jgi:hypothetical protein
MSQNTKKPLLYDLLNDKNIVTQSFSNKAAYREYIKMLHETNELDWSAGGVFRTRNPEAMTYTLVHRNTKTLVSL